MEKTQFRMNYERDFSLVLEHVWGECMSNEVPEILGIRELRRPVLIQYRSEENLQFWDNEKGQQVLFDAMYERNKRGEEYMTKVLQGYVALLSQIQALHRKGVEATKDDIRETMMILFKMIPLFEIWFYSGIDPRTPVSIVNAIEKVREADNLAVDIETFFKSWAEHRGTDRYLVNFILPDEFPDLPAKAVLEERCSKGVVVLDGKDYFLGSLEEFSESHPEYEFVRAKAGSGSEVSGQSAYGGKVQGIVRVVKNIRMAEKVADGDIIVAPMTTPDFLPAMKRAAAFVTDEGSVLCHAAIVSREMKKPCIIGTKFATQVFQDGDTVEVDADNGIVRKI